MCRRTFSYRSRQVEAADPCQVGAIVEGLDSRVNTVSPQRCPVQVGKKALEYRLILLGMISISFRETKRRIIVKNYARQHAAVVKAPPTITLVVSI